MSFTWRQVLIGVIGVLVAASPLWIASYTNRRVSIEEQISSMPTSQLLGGANRERPLALTLVGPWQELSARFRGNRLSPGEVDAAVELAIGTAGRRNLTFQFDAMMQFVEELDAAGALSTQQYARFCEAATGAPRVDVRSSGMNAADRDQGIWLTVSRPLTAAGFPLPAHVTRHIDAIRLDGPSGTAGVELPVIARFNGQADGFTDGMEGCAVDLPAGISIGEHKIYVTVETSVFPPGQAQSTAPRHQWRSTIAVPLDVQAELSSRSASAASQPATR